MRAAGIRPPSGALRAGNAVPLAIHQNPSPNFGVRRDGLIPRFVVLHYTAMASAQDAIERLCDANSAVSSHYVICKAGSTTQLVGEGMRAWHAGAGEWCALTDMNSRSIGIELDNDGQSPFPDALMNSLERLLRSILHTWDIPPDNVIGHSDMAPGRKFDPGPWFDWSRLEAAGLARPRGKPDMLGAPDPDLFDTLARKAGYTCDVDHTARLAAVRLRYRGFADGPLCAEDLVPLASATRGI